MSNLLAKLASIAEGQIGHEESPRGSNKGEALAAYFHADNYVPATGKDEGYPWCAAFVSWCVQKFLQTKDGVACFACVIPPRLAAAWSFETWAGKQGALVFDPREARQGTEQWPQPGDIVTYTFSHVGIVLVAAADNRVFTAVEGNSNSDGGRDGYAVVKHGRTFGQVRKFIRLTPKAEAVA